MDRSLLAIATQNNNDDSIDDGIDYTEEQILESKIEPNKRGLNNQVDNQVYEEFKEKNMNSLHLLNIFRMHGQKDSNGYPKNNLDSTSLDKDSKS